MTEPAAANPEPPNPLARFVTWNMLGDGASLLIGFGASIALARWLGPSNRGLLALMLSVAMLVLALTAAGMPVAVVYFASRHERDGPAILGNCLRHAAILAAILVPAALIFNRPISDALAHGHGGRTWALAAALVPITFLDWTTHSQLQGTLRFGRFNVLLVLQRITYALGVLILLGVLKLGVASGLLATALGSFVMIAGSLPPILKYGRPRLDRRLLRRMMRYGWRAEIGSVLQQTNARFDVIILQFFRPLSQVGYYVVAQTVAELVLQLADSFQWSNMALVSREERSDQQASRSTTAIRHYALISCAGVLGDAVFGSALIWFAYGPRFHEAVVPMLILLPGVWMLGIGFVVQGDLGGRGRPGISSAVAALSAAVTVVLDLTLIPVLGVNGAALASVCAYATFGIGSLVALRRVSGLSVRELAVPRRADLQAYWHAIASAPGRLRERRRRQRDGEPQPHDQRQDPGI